MQIDNADFAKHFHSKSEDAEKQLRTMKNIPTPTRATRIEVVLDFIGRRRPTSVLDIGARDLSMLAALDPSIVRRRAAVDLEFRGSASGIETCRHDLRQALPYGAGEFECVTALDVLEHIEDKQRVFRDLVRVSAKYVVVSLPNINSITYLVSMIRGRPLSAHYRFSTADHGDRHRWAPSYPELFEWAEEQQSTDLQATCLAQTVANWRRLPLMLLPRYMQVFNVVFLFEKQ